MAAVWQTDKRWAQRRTQGFQLGHTCAEFYSETDVPHGDVARQDSVVGVGAAVRREGARPPSPPRAVGDGRWAWAEAYVEGAAARAAEAADWRRCEADAVDDADFVRLRALERSLSDLRARGCTGAPPLRDAVAAAQRTLREPPPRAVADAAPARRPSDLLDVAAWPLEAVLQHAHQRLSQNSCAQLSHQKLARTLREALPAAFARPDDSAASLFARHCGVSLSPAQANAIATAAGNAADGSLNLARLAGLLLEQAARPRVEPQIEPRPALRETEPRVYAASLKRGPGACRESDRTTLGPSQTIASFVATDARPWTPAESAAPDTFPRADARPKNAAQQSADALASKALRQNDEIRVRLRQANVRSNNIFY
ncbi:hypothetical protein M885DRAFT_620617 [Pelagophyceae sp. CCMP2097]|nr:hypothetical protein M885DRAFT_620617 [Pelagophyceae sp. CCMP2097]